MTACEVLIAIAIPFIVVAVGNCVWRLLENMDNVPYEDDWRNGE